MTRSGTFPSDSLLSARDQYLVPSLLAPFANDMARRLTRISMGPLLETSADTGTLTQAIAATVSAGLTIFATDPSLDMIDYAAAKPGVGRVTWQTADPRALPFEDASFGVVTNHFGVVGMADRIRAYQEARRVMKQGARLVFSVPGHLRHNPVAACLQDAMNDLYPDNPPRYVGHILHGYSDNEAVDDDLTIAGFTDAIYTTVDMPYEAASAWDAAMGYCLGTPLRLEIEALGPDELERATRNAAAALERRFGSGAIETSMRSHVISTSG